MSILEQDLKRSQEIICELQADMREMKFDMKKLTQYCNQQDEVLGHLIDDTKEIAKNVGFIFDEMFVEEGNFEEEPKKTLRLITPKDNN